MRPKQDTKGRAYEQDNKKKVMYISCDLVHFAPHTFLVKRELISLQCHTQVCKKKVYKYKTTSNNQTTFS